MDIGINYISDINNDIYKYLLRKRYINTIKFPGKHCNYEELKKFLQFIDETGSKADIHGLPEMVPAINSKRFIENVKWNEILEILPKISRISTHMGLENKEILTNNKSDILENNIKKLKNQINCDIGLENIPGGFEFDKKTLTPQFISKSWEKADFGVFDISHAKVAAKDLEMTYQEYLEKIENKEKVQILHVSGNIIEIGERQNQPDKHVLINQQEIEDIIQLLNKFPNTDLIISEYAFNTKYTYEKEIMIEAILLSTIVKTRDLEKSKYILRILEQKLRNDISNIEEIMKGGLI